MEKNDLFPLAARLGKEALASSGVVQEIPIEKNPPAGGIPPKTGDIGDKVVKTITGERDKVSPVFHYDRGQPGTESGTNTPAEPPTPGDLTPATQAHEQAIGEVGKSWERVRAIYPADEIPWFPEDDQILDQLGDAMQAGDLKRSLASVTRWREAWIQHLGRLKALVRRAGSMPLMRLFAGIDDSELPDEVKAVYLAEVRMRVDQAIAPAGSRSGTAAAAKQVTPADGRPHSQKSTAFSSKRGLKPTGPTPQEGIQVRRCPHCGRELEGHEYYSFADRAFICTGCAMRAQELEDARRWAGVELRGPPAEQIAEGPYKGFQVGGGDLRPDPARAAECARRAEEFRRTREDWQKSFSPQEQPGAERRGRNRKPKESQA